MNEIEQILDAMLARNDVSAEMQGDTYTVKAGEITLVLEERHVFLYAKREMKDLLTARSIKVGGHGTSLLQEVDHGKYYTRLLLLSSASFSENYANVLELATRKLGIQQKGDDK
ncbi:MAG: hypothetical protein Q4C88_06060 [Akkermansia sp.]|nr:hypothetical protein [Akkermansia sp.]